jgi:hypothetical protein
MEIVLLIMLTVAGLGGYVVVQARSPLRDQPTPVRTPRDALVTARDKICRQIEIMESRSRDFRRNTSNDWSEEALDTLRAELRAIEEELGAGT